MVLPLFWQSCAEFGQTVKGRPHFENRFRRRAVIRPRIPIRFSADFIAKAG